MARLEHLDEEGAARMVDVGEKPVTRREAVAECMVRMSAQAAAAVEDGSLPKGDALQVARVAGIMAVKRTPDLIPLCHPLSISSVSIDLEPAAAGIRIVCRVRVEGRTGVEMEALTGAAVAGLALIDMTKGLDRGVELESVRLLAKSGGRSGEWRREPAS